MRGYSSKPARFVRLGRGEVGHQHKVMVAFAPHPAIRSKDELGSNHFRHLQPQTGGVYV